MELELTIITPDRRIHLRALRQVLFQTPQGEAGLLPGHAALVSLVKCGILRAFPVAPQYDKPPTCFVTNSGVLRAIEDRVTLLVQHLETEGEINANVAQAEIDEAVAILATLDPVLDEEDHTRCTRIIDFNNAVIALAGEIPARQDFTHVD